jgi:hypothetical protein
MKRISLGWIIGVGAFFSLFPLLIKCASIPTIYAVEVYPYKTKDVWEAFLDSFDTYKSWSETAKFRIYGGEQTKSYECSFIIPLDEEENFIKGSPEPEKVVKRARTKIRIRKISPRETQFVIIMEIERYVRSPRVKEGVWKKVKGVGRAEKQLYEEIKKILVQRKKRK